MSDKEIKENVVNKEEVKTELRQKLEQEKNQGIYNYGLLSIQKEGLLEQVEMIDTKLAEVKEALIENQKKIVELEQSEDK